jgi:hypothetical protein
VNVTPVHATVIERTRFVEEIAKDKHAMGKLGAVRVVDREIAIVNEQLFVVSQPAYLMLSILVYVCRAGELERSGGIVVDIGVASLLDVKL